MVRIDDVVRAYYIRMPSGAPMQGDIWSNVPSPFEQGASGLGLVITPRCDLVHDKAHFLNYLPLIGFDEYMAIEGGFELVQQELFNAQDSRLSMAKDLSIDKLIGAGVPLEEALDVAHQALTPAKWETIGVQRRITELRSATDRVETVQQKLLLRRLDAEILFSIITPKNLMKYKKQIAHNAISDLHFLPPCPPLIASPLIVLLRCIGTCEIRLMRFAVNCTNDADWQQYVEKEGQSGQAHWSLRPERIARLRTPYLESLMARFGALFTRIGTRDIPDDAMKALIEGGE